MWEVNWVVHQIDDIIRFVDINILNKESPNYEEILAGCTTADMLHSKLVLMIENHNFCKAQNFLYKHMDTKSPRHLEVVIDFYSRLNQLDKKTLEKNGLTRDDLKAGLCYAIDAFGITVFS